MASKFKKKFAPDSVDYPTDDLLPRREQDWKMRDVMGAGGGGKGGSEHFECCSEVNEVMRDSNGG